MIYPPIDEGPELFDLTGPYGCSLLPIACELRQREAARTARAARQRGSWLRKAAGALRDILRRADRPRTGPPAPILPFPERRTCPACRYDMDLPFHEACACETCLELDGLGLALVSPLELDTTQALMLARNVAERDGEKALRDALHHLLVLHLVPGQMEGVVPFLARASQPITGALTSPRKDVN